jgi:hypothetical protein
VGLGGWVFFIGFFGVLGPLRVFLKFFLVFWKVFEKFFSFFAGQKRFLRICYRRFKEMI